LYGVYTIQTGGRRGNRILSNNRAVILHQGGQRRCARGVKGWLVRAQQPRSKRISCKGQGVVLFLGSSRGSTQRSTGTRRTPGRRQRRRRRWGRRPRWWRRWRRGRRGRWGRRRRWRGQRGATSVALVDSGSDLPFRRVGLTVGAAMVAMATGAATRAAATLVQSEATTPVLMEESGGLSGGVL